MSDAEEGNAEEVLELTPQEEKLFRETYNALSKGRGDLPVNLIGQALRMNNQCPTEAELQKIIEDHRDEDAVDPDEMPKVDFEEFCTIMKENWKTRDQLEDQLKAAFATFDKAESGIIEAEDFKNWMMTLGEALEEGEINELLKDAGTLDGKVPYDQFVPHLLDAYGRPASKKPKGSAKKGGKKSAASSGKGKK
ncbi:hypothetical protein BOX15_Mlig023662g1 [Macrostomum lignano]|uniref:EF-hand domain-containing protein n=1 Tax=Macrostomum lignano TaxID=282301 RepID=A0A267F0S6_9PLAT|nr:hypothetical protein BOX15_Mlig023662g1 [Macrostomum lignano]